MQVFDRRTEMPWQYRALHYTQSHGKNQYQYMHGVASLDGGLHSLTAFCRNCINPYSIN